MIRTQSKYLILKNKSKININIKQKNIQIGNMSKKIFTKNKIKYSGKFKICFLRNGESLFNKLFSVISVKVALK